MSIKRFLDFKCSLFNFFLLALLSLSGTNSYSQIQQGILKGKVIDGTTYNTLFGVAVSFDDSSFATLTSADGNYTTKINKGIRTVFYKLPGFQAKAISQVTITKGEVTYLNIILYPFVQPGTNRYNKYKDSLNTGDSVLNTSFFKEHLLRNYNPAWLGKGFPGDVITGEGIRAGTDKNTLFLIKRLNGVVLQGIPFAPYDHTFLISGMGNRYNQLLLNAAVLSSYAPLANSYPLESLPSEAVEEVSVQKISNGSLPSNFSGGTISLKTKDYTDRDFFYIKMGIDFNQETGSKTFYGDKRNDWEPLGFSGSQRSLPGSFPTTRSEFPFSARNLQEQVYLSKLLKNNLAPVSYGSQHPNEKALIGFGKLYKLKTGAKISVISFINQNKSEVFDESTVQVSPNVSDNPYPFNDADKVLIHSQSTDSKYSYSSQLSGIINASIVYGRNKISFRNFFGSQLSNTYTRRNEINKPDEDTLAHTGINYSTSQTYFLNTQLAGEHALGNNGKLKMDWQVTYSYINQQNPDERNFLLREDSTGKGNFEIATPLTLLNNQSTPGIVDASFTNSGRLWRKYTDNNFTGSFNLGFPFNLLRQPQVLSGGIYIQQKYRVFYSDMLLYSGKGFVSLDNLIAPERFYPGGLTVENFFTNEYKGITSLNKRDLGNYTASANSGASYISFDNRLKNNLTIHWGLRFESNSILASNTRYTYFGSFRYPKITPVFENSRISSFNFLPSVNLVYKVFNKINLNAAYFKTLNTPQLQELVQYSYYDPYSFTVKTGNPILSSSTIQNFNAGANFLIDALSGVSISAFYKKIDQPIENIVSGYGNGNILSTPYNTPPATVRGLEASIRLDLGITKLPWLSGVSVFANGNITESNVEAGPVKSATITEVTKHKLSGTPDYMFNTGLVIQKNSFPELSIIYSNTGDYINALGSGEKYKLSNGNTVLQTPDYRMKGTDDLDIQIAQKFYKNKIEIIAGVNNLLSRKIIQYQDLNGNKKFDNSLVVTSNNMNGGAGYFVSGIDNTVISIKKSPVYYFSLSYLFK